jgi:hypothetical protein
MSRIANASEVRSKVIIKEPKGKKILKKKKKMQGVGESGRGRE